MLKYLDITGTNPTEVNRTDSEILCIFTQKSHFIKWVFSQVRVYRIAAWSKYFHLTGIQLLQVGSDPLK